MPHLPPLNTADLLSLCGGDAAIVADILRSFVMSADGALDGLAACDAQERSARGHRLKGLAASVGAAGLAQAAARLEATPADAQVTQLLGAYDVVKTYLSQL